jgi:hypothetical protein
MKHGRPLAHITDDELLRRLAELLRQSRRVESDLVAHIAEVDERRLYAREASPSMFAYCTEVLHLSEAEAYLRITVARASREHPMLLTMLGDGRLHLTAIAKLAPHLTLENREALLGRATHRSKRQIEELIAELAPRPDAPALMRRLPERPILPAPVLLGPDGAGAGVRELGGDGAGMATSELGPGGAAGPAAPAPSSPGVARPSAPAIVQPLAPARYKVQFTASAQLHDKLECLRALLRSEIPDGDLGAVIERAVTETLESRRFARTGNPRKGLAATDTSPSSRRIPAAVRRAVRERDQGRCCYLGEGGRRCSDGGRLEYHHRRPFGLGGDHSPQNIGLACRLHNLYLAEHDYGREAIARYRRSPKPVSSLRASTRGS